MALFSNSKMAAVVCLKNSDLVDTEYNPDLGGIILDGAGKRITLVGTNLVDRFDLIADHQLGEVTQQHEPDMETALTKASDP